MKYSIDGSIQKSPFRLTEWAYWMSWNRRAVQHFEQQLMVDLSEMLEEIRLPIHTRNVQVA